MGRWEDEDEGVGGGSDKWLQEGSVPAWARSYLAAEINPLLRLLVYCRIEKKERCSRNGCL